MRFLQKKGGREGGSVLGVHRGWPGLWDPPGPGRCPHKPIPSEAPFQTSPSLCLLKGQSPWLVAKK